MRYKLTVSVDPEILKRFRRHYSGSISSFLDGLMAEYLFLSDLRIKNLRPAK